MGKQTTANQTATLWKWGTKWNGLRGWKFAGCHRVRERRRPGILSMIGQSTMIKRARERFGNSKHRAARVLRFNAKQIRKQGHK